MPRLAGYSTGRSHPEPGQDTPSAARPNAAAAAAAAATAVPPPAFQLDVLLPRLRLSAHPLMPHEVWLVSSPCTAPWNVHLFHLKLVHVHQLLISCYPDCAY